MATPQITSDPSIYQLAVLQYVSSPQCQTPSIAKYLLNIEGVVFTCGYSCICALDSDKEIVAYIHIPEDQRQRFRDSLAPKTAPDGNKTVDMGKYVSMLPIAIDLIAKQVCAYHTVCAKIPPDDLEPPKGDKLIDEMKRRTGAELVFRGPRMEDGRVRMIFLVPGGISAEKLVEEIKKD